ncbi:MAG TPA: mechanosensitive ion channel family protein [Candidatus Eisenbacteria bacterium]|jgi:small-conductance mechanosensitive channel|nr:mechanosensitive ion channel family protein [Candidatus Eisenbacteria bacterium]
MTSQLLHDWLNRLAPYLYAPAVTFAGVLALFLAKRIVFRRLAAWAAKTAVTWDDLIVRALSMPLNLVILASGGAMFVFLLPLPVEADHAAMTVLQGTVILAVVLFADRMLTGLLAQKAGSAVFGSVSQGVMKGLVRGFVIGLGALIFLDLIGISITPILASLGIGSLAVALALQDTLSNFFAGLYVAIDKPVRTGDFVKIEGGFEGYVIDVGWRSTRIRELANNIIIIPNAKLMGSVIKNFYLPDKEYGFTMEMTMHYDCDLVKAEKILVEVATQVMRSTPGAVKESESFVRFHTWGESSIGFSVILRAQEFVDNYLLKHEFIKAVQARFRKEGYPFPYPTRTLNVESRTVKDLKAVLGGDGAGTR